MDQLESDPFQYPTTRYSGSKRRLLTWIWDNLRSLEFRSVLDVFGGSASTSLLFKRKGKRVHYNDILAFNQIVGTAIIENRSVTVTDDELETIFGEKSDNHPTFIQDNFSGLYFLDEENEWLDQVIANIHTVDDKFKRSILSAGLFQACLAKRPFNMFHRANLSIRLADVKRTFGNKTTWEKPFPTLMRRFVREYNSAVFCNGKENRVIGGYDALNSPNGVDLVYLDPPYVAKHWSEGTDYRFLYHFLEGIAEYDTWNSKLDTTTKTKRLKRDETNRFLTKTDVTAALFDLIERFRTNILVISYRDNGFPSRESITGKLEEIGKSVQVVERVHKYALSGSQDRELLIVAK